MCRKAGRRCQSLLRHPLNHHIHPHRRHRGIAPETVCSDGPVDEMSQSFVQNVPMRQLDGRLHRKPARALQPCRRVGL
jgi:hypothetical protein